MVIPYMKALKTQKYHTLQNINKLTRKKNISLKEMRYHILGIDIRNSN